MNARHLGGGWYLARRPYWRGYIDYGITSEAGRLRRLSAIAVERSRRLIGRIPYGPTRHPR